MRAGIVTGRIMKTFKLVIPSTPDQIQKVERYTEKIAGQIGFSQDEKDSLAIAITEVVANAIYHGNKSNPKKKVYLNIETHPKTMIIRIRDEGSGFDPDKIADPLHPKNLLKDSGRGIYIIRALMDEVSFKYVNNGTEVTLIKRSKNKKRHPK